MTPDWNPELADGLWKELRERTAAAPVSAMPAPATSSQTMLTPGVPEPSPPQGPIERPRIWSRKARLAASGIALLLSLLLMSARALLRGEFPLVGSSALACAMFGIVLLDQTLPGPALGSPSAQRRPIALARGLRRSLLSFLAIGTLIAFVGLAESFLHLNGDFHVPFVHCATHALITGLLALGSLLWIWRRTDPFSPALTGALLGATSGIIGATAVTFVCSNREGFHLLLGHGLSTTALAILGAWLGRRWLAP